ncbi:hypothetical protein [Owenweeksia hongkongensis]|uniref:hypothetical protein n=1 Tax=Owenweeksia hongkongensis TaxID=253245 RepID=UPI003A90A84D
MMLKNIFYQVFSFLYFASFGQQMPLNKVGEIPEEVSECSGIAMLPSGNFAMINDSGNEPEIFITNNEGKLLKTIPLPNVVNTDWEELEYDQGYLYIGDFGNNKNKRTDLCILKYQVSTADSLYNLEEIKFNFKEQQEFPEPKQSRNFDCESMVHLGDSIYVFTKNRTKPFTGYTYLYGMPTKAGNYSISRLDSFKTGHGDKSLFWVAGAALSPSKDKLVLLGYDKMWVFTDFKDADFFGGNQETYAFRGVSQKESITFTDKESLLITDEQNELGGGFVYTAYFKFDDKVKISVETPQFDEQIKISMNSSKHPKLQYELLDTKGMRTTFGIIPEHARSFTIDTRDISAGGYVLSILIDGKPLQAIKLKKLYAKKNK